MQRLAVEDLDWRIDGRLSRRQKPPRWLQRFEQAIATLGVDPLRRPLARESTKTDLELRDFLFGRKPNVFRVIFTIDQQTVRVLRIRRAQMRFLSEKQIRDATGAGQ